MAQLYTNCIVYAISSHSTSGNVKHIFSKVSLTLKDLQYDSVDQMISFKVPNKISRDLIVRQIGLTIDSSHTTTRTKKRYRDHHLSYLCAINVSPNEARDHRLNCWDCLGTFNAREHEGLLLWEHQLTNNEEINCLSTAWVHHLANN